MLIPDEHSPAAVDPKLLEAKSPLFLGFSNTPPGSPSNPVRMSSTPTSVTKKPSSSKLRRTKTMDAKPVTSRSPGDLRDELAMDKPKSTAKRRKSHAVETLSRIVAEESTTKSTGHEHAPAAPKSTAKRQKSHAVETPSNLTAEKEPTKSSVAKTTPSAPEPVQSPCVETLPKDTSGPAPAPSEHIDHALAVNVAAMLSQMQPMLSPQTASPAVTETSTPVVHKKQKGKDKDRTPTKEALPLNSDDLAIGLPKEQYKPRPSRSRSARIVEDTSIDYSKRPETLTASKLKRRKTTNEISPGSPKAIVDADKLAQIGSMGFTPRQTKAALEESSGNIERAVENLLAQSSGGKENSPSKKPSKTRSKSTKQAKANKQPETENPPSELLTVQVTQGSGDKTFYPTVDEVELRKSYIPAVQEMGKKKELLEDKIGLATAPLPAIKPVVEAVVAKETTTQKTPNKTSSTQKRRRDKVADSGEEDEITAEPEPIKPTQKHASKRKVVDSNGEDEIAAAEPEPAKSVPKTVSKRKVVDSDEEEDVVAEPEQLKTTPKPTAKRAKSLPTKKSKTNADGKENMDVAAPTQPAKKGRGRPKKVVEAAMDVEPVEPPFTEPTEEIVTLPKSPDPEILPANGEEPKERLQTPGSTPKSAAIPPSTPEQHSGSSQKSAATKVTAQHSPLNKSKVPLRVGLSRKKRIAPLLKIIKK